jgi:hypothetical protein
MTRNERILNTFCVSFDPNSYGSERYVVLCDGKRVGPSHSTERAAVAEMQYHQSQWLLIYAPREGLSDAECVALDKLQRGEGLGFSTGVCGSLTCGYGKCDEYGYWEFPLPAEKYRYINMYLLNHRNLLLNREF